MHPHDNHHLEASRVAMLVPGLRRSFVTSALSIAIFSALLFPFGPIAMGLWLVLRLIVSVVGFAAITRVGTATSQPARQQVQLAMIMATSGFVWGLIPAFVQPSAPEWRAVIILWLFGNQSVVTAVCAPSPSVFRAALGSVTLVGAVTMAGTGDSFGLVLALLLLLGGAYSISIGTAMHRVATAAIEGRLETAGLAASLSERTSELEELNRSLEHMALTDGLTGLPNRRSFTSVVPDEDGRVRAACALGFIDIDHFKEINDERGHGAGDLVLITVADRWRRLLPHDALLARTGGDEFALHLADADADRLLALTQRLRAALDEPVALDERNVVAVSCSIGICSAGAGEPFATAMARADAALYDMKRNGRNGVTVSTVSPL